MPKTCCRCNASGRCTNCSCKKANRVCVNCLPSRQGHCNNPPKPDTTEAAEQGSEQHTAVPRSETQDQASPRDGGNGPVLMATPTPSENLTPQADTSPTSTASQLPRPTTKSTEQQPTGPAVTGNPDNPSREPPPPPLPEYMPAPHPTFRWGDKDGKTFINSIELCYSEIVHWRKNLFRVPTGKAGKAFVQELARLFRAFADSSALESVAMRAAMVMPVLLIQKPHHRSRLKLWSDGDLDALLNEGRTIQTEFKHHFRQQNTNNTQTARSFAKLVMEGKMRAALHLLSHDNNNGPLPLDSQVEENGTPKTVREILQAKHPPQQPAKPTSLVDPDTQQQPTAEPHPILFEKIDGQLIRSMALRTDGAAGPSGMDAATWKRLCSSFKTASTELCDALAATARKLCSQHVDPSGVSALVACRLIALDKCPGVRPIGVGETARRIIGRAIARAISEDIQEAAGPLQVCAGHLSGCEAAVSAARKLFIAPDTEATILVDASNAFNALNRQAALRNIQHLCPSLSKVLINTYREKAQLFIDGETLLSQEGTTQGDPLAMAMYAIAITPLIKDLEDKSVKQIWYADDATACGKISNLKTWWDEMTKKGPEYGYFPNAAKTWLVVKEEKLEEAHSIFRGTNVSITSDGRKLLGAAIGTAHFVNSYVQQKVAKWTQEVEELSNIAITQPHAAYSAFTHGLISKWTYLSRTIPDIESHMKPLEDAIRQKLLPTITGQNAFNDLDRQLLALPVRHGGLGIIDPTKRTELHHSACDKITAPLTELILSQSKSYPPQARAAQQQAKNRTRTLRRQQEAREANEIKEKLTPTLKRAIDAATEKGASSWLTTLPIAEHGFALHKGAFRDALCLRYGWHPSNLPSHCICNQKFTVEHALSCSRGGFPQIRHNELRDITAEMMKEVCHNVSTEPHLQPVTREQLRHRTANREEGARLDVVATNFWGRDRQQAYFDIRVFNPFAQTHRTSTLSQCHKRQEREKRRTYEERVREIEHGSFTPLVFSTSGGMGPTTTTAYKRLAALISEKHNQQYSTTLHWMRCRLSLSLIRSAIMCLRGARSTYHHPTFSGDSMDVACSEGRIFTQD